MQNLFKVGLVSLFLCACTALVSAKPPEMKTHRSTAPGAKVTVVHFSAPW